MTRVTAWVAAATLLLTGCAGTSQETDASSLPSGGTTNDSPSLQHYVALGDSFTAAPYVPTTDLAEGCLRSDGNYPSLVAERLGIADFTDVSCSAAEIRDLHRPQQTFRRSTVSAQLAALTKRTDLVTMSIGGNDFNLFGNLLQTCTKLRALDPEGAPCTDKLALDGIDPDRQVTGIGTRLRRAVDDVARRSPEARILVVGYPRIAPADGTCPRLLPLATGDTRTAFRIAEGLRRAMEQAARATGGEFVDMHSASRRHDVCARTPWVNGRFTDRSAALAFHPLAAGMRAVAARIVTRIQRRT